MALTFHCGKTLLRPTISICSVCQRPHTTTFGLGRSCLYGACRPLRHYWTILRQHPRLNDVGIVIILRFVYNHADRVLLYYQPQTWGDRWLKAFAETVTDVDCRNPYSMMQVINHALMHGSVRSQLVINHALIHGCLRCGLQIDSLLKTC